jgi:hypothetical protein
MIMSTVEYFKKPVMGFIMLLAMWASLNSYTIAQDLTAPTRVINQYLASLVNGETQQLIVLIDGNMKNNNKQLALNPETYSQFLREYYQGVRTVVEDIAPDGAAVRARVRFEYPAQDSLIIEFILVQRDGQWRVADEIY